MLTLTLLALLVAGGFVVYRRTQSPPQQPRPPLSNEDIIQRWRELGFFCELDDQSKVWTLTGSRAGLLHFSDLLRGFISDPANAPDGQQQHYGPYGSLQIMTWPDAGFDGSSIRGSLTDLDRLASIVETKLAVAEPGSSVEIREEYAPDSRYSLLLDVRINKFDPASADPERLGSAAQRKIPAD